MIEEGDVVYVVTNPENGWDCVLGVFSSIESLRQYLAPEEDWDDEGVDIREDSEYYNASIGELEDLEDKLIIHTKYLD